MMKVIYGISIIFICLSIISCGPIPGMTIGMAKRETAKSRPEYKQFQALCNAEERSIVYERVRVDGYLFAATSGARCNGGWDVLVEKGYGYYECSTAKVLDYESITDGEIYRLEIGEDNDPGCMPWDEVAHIKAREYQERLKGKCFIKSKVVEPKNGYVKLLEFGYVNKNGSHILEFPNDSTKKNLISFSGVTVFGLKDKRIFSIDRDYKYWPEGIDNKAVGKFTCDKDVYVIESEVLKAY